MSKKEKYKRCGYEDAYDTEKENNWTNRLYLDDCIEIMNNQFNEIIELKQQIKDQRHQICEKIREWAENDWDWDDFNLFLDRVEKEEEE